MTDETRDKASTKSKGGRQKGVPCPQRGKPIDRIRTKSSRAIRLYSILWSNPTSWALDQRTNLAKHLAQVREGLMSIFHSPGPDRAASMLIDRITYKSLKLCLFEVADLTALADAPTTPGVDQPEPQGGPSGFGDGNFTRYVQISNSLREDLRLLCGMAKTQSPTQNDPDLQEYLNALRKAGKAQVVTIERE